MINTDEYTITLSLPRRKEDSRPYGFQRLNKDHIYSLLARLRDMLTGYTIEFTKESDPSIAARFGTFMDKAASRKLLKNDLEDIYLSLGSDLSNVVALIRTVPHMADVWELLIKKPVVSDSSLEKVLGRKPETVTPDYWYFAFFNEPAFFPLRVSEKNRDYYYYSRRKAEYDYSLTPKIRKKLLEMLHGADSLSAVTVKDLPEGEDLVTENFESQLGADVVFLSGLALTGSPLTSTGALTASKLNTIKKSFITPGFRPYGVKYPLDRVELLVISYFDAYRKKKEENPMDSKSFAKFVLDRMAEEITGTQFGAYFPEFKGMTKASTADSNARIFSNFMTWFLKQAHSDWASLANMRKLFLCYSPRRNGTGDYIPLFGPKSRTDKFEYKDPAETEKNKGLTDFDRFDIPFLLRWLRYLCAMGILETAAAETPETDDPLEGLRYVRLTSLGRFALGIDRKYEPHTHSSLGNQIEYDDASGIITLLDDNCPFYLFITQIATPISSRRYRITENSLLKNCTDSSDLDSYIRNLKSIISLDDNPILRRMAEEASNRCDISVPIPKTYTMIQMRSNVPGLADAIRDCKEIRENVILAEEGILLMEYSFQTRFRELLRQRGYLLD